MGLGKSTELLCTMYSHFVYKTVLSMYLLGSIAYCAGYTAHSSHSFCAYSDTESFKNRGHEEHSITDANWAELPLWVSPIKISGNQSASAVLGTLCHSK